MLTRPSITEQPGPDFQKKDNSKHGLSCNETERANLLNKVNDHKKRRNP